MTLINRIKRSIFARWFKIQDRLNRIGKVRILDYEGAELCVLAGNLREAETRANSCAKEPETVEWIEAYCKPGTVFYDIGANIGAYSLVAAANKAQVYAFEPAYQNFFRLCQNVSLNNMDSLISCFPIAFSSSTAAKNFVYLETSIGTSRCYHNKEIDLQLNVPHQVIRKKTLIYRLDEFQAQFELPCPHMLKIDVDGAEKEIIEGASQILANPELKTVLIEIDELKFQSNQILEILHRFRFAVEGKHHRSGKIYNYITKRGSI